MNSDQVDFSTFCIGSVASALNMNQAEVYLHSRRYLDFGQGFYVTPTKIQAVNYLQQF